MYVKSILVRWNLPTISHGGNGSLLLGKEPLSLSQLEHGIKKITQKMLLEQLKELISFGIISKQTFAGYPLKVEYSLTDRGRELLQAITIMQKVGIELMLENGMKDVLIEKGFID
ncbi:HxlR family transcriptional regulator [Lacrimispora xylanisolvens]|uniref:HxlR family transcriptional regulator n=1 Tax=Lacrimispora xylanisolvens TaxID=384636 RepID=A0A2S6HAR4_9FIRM|nr:HxlR family transcriptional regulator [Hungatella xylanolytica]